MNNLTILLFVFLVIAIIFFGIVVFGFGFVNVNAVIIETEKGDCVAAVDTGKESEEECERHIDWINQSNTKNQSPSELAKAANLTSYFNNYSTNSTE